MTATTTAAAGPPALGRGETALFGTAIAAGVGVGALGLAASFEALREAAARWGFASPWMLPVGVDIAIPVFTLANLLLIRMDMRLAWVRYVPWALTLVTCWLNIAAGESVSAKVAHGAMPLLWVVLSEIAAHVYAVRIGAATGKRMERIRRSRWLLAPASTFALWRRMVLWEITSYPDALTRERERQLARADLRETYGRSWRRTAPHRERILLKLGDLTPDTTPAPEPVVICGSSGTLTIPALPTRPRKGRTGQPRKAPAVKTGGRAKPAAPRRSDAELLDQARQASGDWPDERVTADRLREVLRCAPGRARWLRETLLTERTQQSTTGTAAAPDAAGAELAGVAS